MQILIAPRFPRADTIRLGFHDRNSDDDYSYKVIYRGVSDPRIRQYTRSLDVSTGKVGVPIEKPHGSFVFVLQGFQLAFPGDDHHVNEVGVNEIDGVVDIEFGDAKMNKTYKCLR